MFKKLTTWILIAAVAGVVAGWIGHDTAVDTAAATRLAGYFSILSDVFLRLIKVIIAPLVFATVVSGIAGMGDAKAVGRIGGKALLWFITASLVSLLLGMVLANLLQPGSGLALALPDRDAATNLKTGGLNLRDFVAHMVPRSFFEAMATNEILQILTKMVKQRQESAKAFEEGKRPELAAKENAEIAIIDGFLPSQMNEAEMRAAIGETIRQTGATGLRDMGKVMNALKEQYPGQMDFGKASAVVKSKLGG